MSRKRGGPERRSMASPMEADPLVLFEIKFSNTHQRDRASTGCMRLPERLRDGRPTPVKTAVWLGLAVAPVLFTSHERVCRRGQPLAARHAGAQVR